MLTRRSLLASTAVLAAGCNTVGLPLSPPSAPQVAEINVAAYHEIRVSFHAVRWRTLSVWSPEEKYQRAVTALEEDRENHDGPARMADTVLCCSFFEDDYGTMEEPPKNARGDGDGASGGD